MVRQRAWVFVLALLVALPVAQASATAPKDRFATMPKASPGPKTRWREDHFGTRRNYKVGRTYHLPRQRRPIVSMPGN